ncbi:MAG: cytochrome c3 family protein [Sandaracinaceae bacterium]|nr:cytochrome c3 family protein [Sandaracinaceae bacterium]
MRAAIAVLVVLSATSLFAIVSAQDRAPSAPRPAPPSAPRRNPHNARPNGIENADCSTCHSVDGWNQGGGEGGSGAFDHSRTGFPLNGRHRQTACNECHVPSRTITRECIGCHIDAHAGRQSSSCDTCHSARSWNQVNAFEIHRNTRLPLSGMHALVECSECHVRQDPRRYTAVPADCFSCHDAEYRRPTTHPNHLGDPGDPMRVPFPQDCTLCHSAMSWSPATIDASVFPSIAGLSAPSNHELVFPIESGRHRGASCDSCHRSMATPQAVSCIGCHAHSPGMIAAQHRMSTSPTDSIGCVRCHPGGARR